MLFAAACFVCVGTWHLSVGVGFVGSLNWRCCVDISCGADQWSGLVLGFIVVARRGV